MSTVMLVDAHEPGAIARSGRSRGKPLLHGSAVIEVSNKPEEWARFDDLLKVMESCIDALRKCGAESLTLSCSLFHDGQCNFGFSTDELQRIAALKVNLHLSCYEDEP
ncbi:MAG: hypothetical protein ABI273_09565 [Lacunisphaera sp.]